MQGDSSQFFSTIWRCCNYCLNFIIFVEYLKPIAAREREIETAQAKERAELEAIRKAEAAKSMFTFNYFILLWSSWLATKLFSSTVVGGMSLAQASEMQLQCTMLIQ